MNDAPGYRRRLLAVGPLPARVLIVSDAWLPQVNGVVRTLQTISGELRALGHAVEIIGPDRFPTIPCPTYPDIRLVLFPGWWLDRLIEGFAPDALHIATEGPLGLAARKWARRRGCAFTTTFHTQFPEYVNARVGIPTSWLYAWLRGFHNSGQGVIVATPSLRRELSVRGFREIRDWSRGVDLAQFRPVPAEDWKLPRPVFAYVGRVAVEKHFRVSRSQFAGLQGCGQGGPQLATLKRAIPASPSPGRATCWPMPGAISAPSGRICAKPRCRPTALPAGRMPSASPGAPARKPSSPTSCPSAGTADPGAAAGLDAAQLSAGERLALSPGGLSEKQACSFLKKRTKKLLSICIAANR